MLTGQSHVCNSFYWKQLVWYITDHLTLPNVTPREKTHILVHSEAFLTFSAF